jgi:flagellar hook-associated protein FlgK
VQVNERRDGSNGVDVIVLGTPLVISGNAAGLEAGVMHDGKLGLSAAGANYYTSDVHGGQIGGLIALYNDLLVEAQDDLNALADGIITGTNRQHVRGVGTAGSFDQLTGTRIADADALLADWNAPVTAGILRLRVVAPDGTVARYAVAVDPTTDTLNTIAAALDALDPAHLSASVVDSRLRLEGKAGYQFDFLPPATLALGPPWTGTSAPTPSGSYTGAANETYTFTVTAGGQVGVDAGVTVEVHDAVGGLVATLDVGAAYTPGTALAVENGLEVAFSAGAVVTDEQFVIDAVADPVAPAVRLRPAWNGTAAPSLSGLYEGAINDEFTFIVVGAGQVGVEPDLAVEVRNGAGELVTTLEVGQGYAAGDPLSIYEGLQVAFDVGTLAAGESFRVEAIADSDTSGLLAAAGSNTLFSGTLAENMALREDVAADPRRLVTARGEAMADNAAVRAMAALGEQQLEALGGAAPTDFYRVMVTGVGQKIAFRDTRLRSLRDALQQLENQRDRLSGVDLNNEAADMLVFERMFQAMAKFLNTQHEAMNTLMDLL